MSNYEQAAKLNPRDFGGGDEAMIAKESAFNTVVDLDKRGRTLIEQGSYGEAEKLFRQALKTGTETLGEREPATLAVLNNSMMGSASQAMAETSNNRTDGAPTMSRRPRRSRIPRVLKRAFCRGG